MNAIEVRDVHISYKTIKAKSIRQTLFSLKKSTSDRYEAVRGVSFDIKKGEIVLKYGCKIGFALASIKKGEHIHTHNLDSKPAE